MLKQHALVCPLVKGSENICMGPLRVRLRTTAPREMHVGNSIIGKKEKRVICIEPSRYQFCRLSKKDV